MDTIEKNQEHESLIIIDSELKDYLLETSKWSKFLAIVGYVGLGLLILLALFVMFGFSQFSQFSHVAFPMGLIGFLYIILAVIYYFPVTYLYKFSVQIKNGLTSNDKQTVTFGFENLKSLFKFIGIFTIVILSMYALILIIVLPLSLMRLV